MIRRILEQFFRKDEPEEEAESVVRVDSLQKWLRGQLKDTLSNHISMLETLFSESKSRFGQLREAFDAFDEAAIRSDDFPDAPSLIERYKESTVQQCKESLDEMAKILDQQADTIEDFFEKKELLERHLENLEKSLGHHAKTLRTYYLDDMHNIQQAFGEIRKDLENVDDILTSPILQRLGETREHVKQALLKRERRKELQKEMDALQAKIDENYKEFLRYDGKIREIRRSKRYELEKQVPRGKNPNTIGHFSVMDHEVKELERRKKQIDTTIRDLRADKKKLYDAHQRLALDPHMERLTALIEQLSQMKVTIVHD